MIKYKKLPENIDESIGSLVAYLEGDRNTVFAYLFGGILRTTKSPLRDIDIAVYVADRKKLDYIRMFHNVTDALGTEEVDLVVLNDAPISLSGRIVQNRKVLVDKRPFVRHQFESLVLRKYFDFRERERMLVKRRYGIG